MDVLKEIEKVNPEFAKVLRKMEKVDVLTTRLDLSFMGLTSLKGIEYFENLEILHCKNNQLTSLGLSKNVNLRILCCDDNDLISLDVSKNASLIGLRCENNQLTNLDLSNNTNLEYLRCDGNQLTSLDLSKNEYLTFLNCSKNLLTSLYVSDSGKLTSKGIFTSYGLKIIKKINVLKEIEKVNPELAEVLILSLNTTNLSEEEANKIIRLDINIGGYKIDSLEGLEYFKNLAELECEKNQLTSLDVSENVNLEYLRCDGNQLTSLDVSKNLKIKYLICSRNQLTSLDISKNINLERLYCWVNQLASLDLSNNPKLTPDTVHIEKGVKIKWHKSIESEPKKS